MATPVPAHPVPAGPLAVRWHAYDIPKLRAGTATPISVELENAGSATWRAKAGKGIFLAYHWLDLRGNAIIWAPEFIALPWPVPPGHRFALQLELRAPIPPSRYRLAIDLVDEGRSWFAELGNPRLETEIPIYSRLAHRMLSVRIADGPADLAGATRTALDEQEEPVTESGEAIAFLAPGCRPSPDWSRRILDLHDEGYAAVGGSISLEGRRRLRRQTTELEPWRPGFGRAPGWSLPLLCPSLVADLAGRVTPLELFAGLPALETSGLDQPWICDGRVTVTFRQRPEPARSRSPR